MLDRQDDEPAWTRWLAHLFRLPSTGEAAWSGFCEVVAGSMDARHDLPNGRVATASDWRAAAGAPPEPAKIETERPTGDGGFMDVTVDRAELFAVVENKLWEGWHDRPAIRQDECYEQAAGVVAAGRKVGLVFLSAYEADEAMRRRSPAWVFITWAAFARALRRRLKQTPGTLSAEEIQAVPLLLTVAAIEQDLLGFRLDACVQDTAKPWRSLDLLARMTRHLEESYGEC
jgi:hypothetical protein